MDKFYRDVHFRDRRLKGTMPLLISGSKFELDETVSLFKAFTFLFDQKEKRGEKLSNLLIYCHGKIRKTDYQSGEFNINGGQGLQLGLEDVISDNIFYWGTIRNMVKNIIIFACSPADSPQNADLTDGKQMMSQLAKQTNANVYASEDIQWYYLDGMDFSAWEGKLFKFSPGGKTERAFGFQIRNLLN